MRGVSSGWPSSSSRSLTKRDISSTARRDFMKQIVRAPSATSSATMSAASASAERRVPSASSVSGGFHIAIVRRAPGEPSSLTTAKSGSPVRRSASSSGLATVAEASTNRDGDGPRSAAAGAARWRRGSRRRRGRRAPRRPRRPARFARNGAQLAVVGQYRHVQHVRVGQDQVRLAADRGARLARRVPVVDRGPQPGELQGVERARLVLGERLGRVQVQRAGPRVAAQRVQHGQVEGQRLAATRCPW